MENRQDRQESGWDLGPSAAGLVPGRPAPGATDTMKLQGTKGKGGRQSINSKIQKDQNPTITSEMLRVQAGSPA